MERSNSVAIPVRVAKSDTGETVIPTRPPQVASENVSYTSLLDSMYDAVFITDMSGRVFDMNPRAFAFFRMPFDATFGFPVLDRIAGADEELFRQIAQNLQENRFTMVEAHCVRLDGTTFPAEIVANRLKLGNRSYFVLFVRDITQRKESRAKLEAANERLRAHDRARMEFISNVSHELRTPLTSMIYGVDSMLRGVVGELSPKARDYVRRLDADCRRLLSTVNDILDLRMIESGTLSLTKVLVPLSRIAKGCVDTLRIQADERRQSLKLSAFDASTFVHCDAQKIERVFINILGNAIKYTPEGGAIELHVRRSEEQPELVEIVCNDNGPGIPSDALRHVLERYYRVGQHIAGTGLGLAISREVVELHGGTIEVRSPVPGDEAGTSILITLPAASPPRILIVEDDEIVQELLSEQLMEEGYNVIGAGSAKSAIELVTEDASIGLVVLDVNLPDVNGTEVILQLRARRESARLPIVAVSGTEPAGGVADILHRFGIPLLRKPWRLDELLTRIGTAFFAGVGRV